MAALNALTQWQSRGRKLRIFGYEVFALTEGTSNAEPLLILHGFPTSSFDFHRVLPMLASHFYVVLHDHIGFGYSDKPENYSYSLVEQAEVALGVWRELGVKRGHLLAHDYGTSIAMELLVRRERDLLPIEILSVTLCNGSVHLELADLTISQRILRNPKLGPTFVKLAIRRIFKAQMRRIFGNPQIVDDSELDLLWDSINFQDGRRRLPQISSYLDERMRFWHRWIDPLTRLDLPVHILWGRRDPVAVATIAERLAAEIPQARLTWLDDLGHYPMLESPEQWAQSVMRFFALSEFISPAS